MFVFVFLVHLASEETTGATEGLCPGTLAFYTYLYA